MEHEDLVRLRLDRIAEDIEQVQHNSRRLLTLGEELLNIEQAQLEAQQTQNMIGWLQLTKDLDLGYDAALMSAVRRRLGI